MRADVYLTFDGNCKDAMTFYKEVFGGGDLVMMTYAESPMKDVTPEHLKGRILHSSLPLSKTFNLMGCDQHPCADEWKGKHTVGNNIEVTLSPDNKEETDRIFAALSKGGTVLRPLEDTFWGSYHGACKDQFGIQWMFDMATGTTPTNIDCESPLKRAIAALRDVANVATKEAESLETLAAAEDAHAKKAKIEEKDLGEA